MSWQSARARVASAPATLVGPETTAIEMTGPDGSLKWRGIQTSPVALHRSANLDRNVYAIARCIVSEVGTGNPTACLAIAETIVNAAARKGIEPYQWLVQLTSSAYAWTRFRYGEQHGRRASTRQDPNLRAVEAARAATAEKLGLVSGAVTWFEPKLQDSGAQGGRQLREDAAELATRWAKEDGLEWIGPLPGIDSYRTACFLRPVQGRPASAEALVRLVNVGRSGGKTLGPDSAHPETAAVARAGAPWLAIVGAAVIIV